MLSNDALQRFSKNKTLKKLDEVILFFDKERIGIVLFKESKLNAIDE